jgi:hypothetical protein
MNHVVQMSSFYNIVTISIIFFKQMSLTHQYNSTGCLSMCFIYEVITYSQTSQLLIERMFSSGKQDEFILWILTAKCLPTKEFFVAS